MTKPAAKPRTVVLYLTPFGYKTTSGRFFEVAVTKRPIELETVPEPGFGEYVQPIESDVGDSSVCGEMVAALLGPRAARKPSKITVTVEPL